ncbi:hypothetical protein BTVI_70646 [Pitangus sulphuratus]|nr:hypothetical protein BTVI_70646 [Pitangus sulphuratus]
MTSSNLAIHLGPHLLSPPTEDLILLEATLVVTEQVNVLMKFFTENFESIFGEEMAALKESSVPTGKWLNKVQNIYKFKIEGNSCQLERDFAQILLHPSFLKSILGHLQLCLQNLQELNRVPGAQRTTDEPLRVQKDLSQLWSTSQGQPHWVGAITMAGHNRQQPQELALQESWHP